MTYSTCSHEHTYQEFQERTFEGEVFRYKALMCKDCGANLWDDKIEAKFYHWLNGLYENQNRNKFQIQFQFSDRGMKCLDKLLEKFPGVERSHLMRALVTVFLDIVSVDEHFSDYTKEIERSFEYSSLVNDQKVKFKLQFKPKALMEIKAVSEILNEKSGKVIEDILNRMVALFIQTNPEIRRYWEDLIFRNLEIILKAA